MTTVAKNFVGVDVSKEWLDIYIYPKDKWMRIDNSTLAITELASTLSLNNVAQIVCESSGGYENLLVNVCTNAGYKVWRIDPKRIRAFIISEGIKAKSDKIDAKMIALFASQKQATDEPYKRSAIDEKLRAFVRRKADLIAMISMEKKRLKGPTGVICKKSIEHLLGIMAEDVENIEDEIQRLIQQDASLNNKNEILQSIPGVGKTTAAALIADMPELGIIDNKKAAALLGVVPYTKQSGMYRGNETISGGRSAPRKALYMAVLSAIRYNPPLKEFYDRLRGNGKKPKVAMVAVMNKLIIRINTMIRKNEKWAHS